MEIDKKYLAELENKKNELRNKIENIMDTQIHAWRDEWLDHSNGDAIYRVYYNCLYLDIENECRCKLDVKNGKCCEKKETEVKQYTYGIWKKKTYEKESIVKCKHGKRVQNLKISDKINGIKEQIRCLS